MKLCKREHERLQAEIRTAETEIKRAEAAWASGTMFQQKAINGTFFH